MYNPLKRPIRALQAKVISPALSYLFNTTIDSGASQGPSQRNTQETDEYGAAIFPKKEKFNYESMLIGFKEMAKYQEHLEMIRLEKEDIHAALLYGDNKPMMQTLFTQTDEHQIHYLELVYNNICEIYKVTTPPKGDGYKSNIVSIEPQLRCPEWTDTYDDNGYWCQTIDNPRSWSNLMNGECFVLNGIYSERAFSSLLQNKTFSLSLIPKTQYLSILL